MSSTLKIGDVEVAEDGFDGSVHVSKLQKFQKWNRPARAVVVGRKAGGRGTRHD